MSKPTIIIIAGGENSRFAPLNTKTHKGFLSLAGIPIVNRAFESLKEHGFYDVILVLSKKDFDGNGFSEYLDKTDHGLNITTVLQEDATGMGDALLLAKEQLSSDTFILASPYYSNLGHIAEQLHQKELNSHSDCVFSGSRTNKTGIYGILKFDKEDTHKVVGIIEKPKKDELAEKEYIKIDSIYLFNSKFLEDLSNTKKDEYSLETAISNFAKDAHCTWILNTGKIQSLKYPWHLFRTFDQIMIEKKTYFSDTAKISDTAIFDQDNGPVIVDDYAIIGDFVKLVGPCYVGRNSRVGDYSFVRDSSIESGAVIGANTEVVRSIMFEDSSIHFGYLADSIIGHSTRIGAGLITANKRHDRKNINIQIKNKLIDTQRNNLGIITGENVSLGIRVNTMPGLTIESNVEIDPGETIKRNVKYKK